MKNRGVWSGFMLGMALAGPLAWGQGLTNAGFEARGLEGWEAFGPGWRTSSFTNETGSDAHSGDLGLVTDIKKGDKDEWRGVSQAVPAKRGSIFGGSVWIRTIKAEDAEAMLEFQFKDGDGNLLDLHQSDRVSGDQPYTQVEIRDVEPPKHTEWLHVRGIVHIKSPPGKETQFIMFDDFELTVTNKSSKSGKTGSRGSSSFEERMAKRSAARAREP